MYCFIKPHTNKDIKKQQIYNTIDKLMKEWYCKQINERTVFQMSNATKITELSPPKMKRATFMF